MLITAAIGAVQVGSAVYSSYKLYQLSTKEEKLTKEEKVEATLHASGLVLGAGLLGYSLWANAAAKGGQMVIGGTIKVGNIVINGGDVLIKSTASIQATTTTINSATTVIEKGAQIAGQIIINGKNIPTVANGLSVGVSIFDNLNKTRLMASLITIVPSTLPKNAKEALDAPYTPPQDETPPINHQQNQLPEIDVTIQDWKDYYRLLPEKYTEGETEYNTVTNPVFRNYQWPDSNDQRVACRYPVLVKMEKKKNDGEEDKYGYVEYSAMVRMLQNNGSINPWTQEPMTIQDLVLDSEALMRIEAEMQRLGLPLK